MLSLILSEFVYDHPGSVEGFLQLEHLELQENYDSDILISHNMGHARDYIFNFASMSLHLAILLYILTSYQSINNQHSKHEKPVTVQNVPKTLA